jgi:hypothetical protein
VLHPEFFETHPDQYTAADLKKFQAVAAPWVRECIVR